MEVLLILNAITCLILLGLVLLQVCEMRAKRDGAPARDVEDAVPYSGGTGVPARADRVVRPYGEESGVPAQHPSGASCHLSSREGFGVDLSGKRKETFRLVLPDGEVLHLFTPTKAVAGLFAQLGVILQRVAKGRATVEDSAELYALAARIMENNAERKCVDAQALFDRLTLDDAAELLAEYLGWLTELIERKN